MKSIFLSIIFSAIRRVVTAELFAQILILVELQTDNGRPGPEKKANVIAQLKKIEGILGESVKALPSWILSMAIDIAVAEFNKKMGKPITN